MAQFNTRELRTWALKGAEQRLVEIAAEANAIYVAFPELRDRGRGPGLRGGTADSSPGPSRKTAKRRRGGRQMSEEGRRRIAEAARRRWAEWRDKQAQPAASAPDAGTSPAPAGRSPKKR